MATTTAARISFDEFCRLTGEQKADLIDGALYLAPLDTTDANDILGWIMSVTLDFVERFDLGRLFSSRVVCRLDEFNALEPDLFFVRKEHCKRVLRDRVDGPPDVAVEVVTDETRALDYGIKRKHYEKFGVGEYWIIDEPRRTATFLRLGREGKYREALIRDGVFHSTTLPEFWLRISWLWPETRPLTLRASAELARSMKTAHGGKYGSK